MAKSPEDRKSETAAAKWHARLLCADVSAGDLEAFEAWRRASESNASAWERMQGVWRGLADLEDHPLITRWRDEALAAGQPSRKTDKDA